MKPQDLRINNWGLFEGIRFQVIGIYPNGLDIENGVEQRHIELDQFEPIALTQEWLVKFGFIPKASIEYDGLTAYEIPSWGRIVIKEGILKTDEYYFLDGLTQEIRYVHQLQNLYYCLTGEDLTIKDELVRLADESSEDYMERLRKAGKTIEG